MAIIPCALPTPKLASRMRLSSFPFPRRPSALPRPLRLRAPKPAAAPSPARIRRNQTTYCQTRAWPISHVIERERSSAKKGFLPARFCASRLARSPRTATACRTARSMPRRTTHHPFSSPAIFPPTRNPLRERHLHVACGVRGRVFPADVPCGCRRARLSKLSLSRIHFCLKYTCAIIK